MLVRFYFHSKTFLNKFISNLKCQKREFNKLINKNNLIIMQLILLNLKFSLYSDTTIKKFDKKQ